MRVEFPARYRKRVRNAPHKLSVRGSHYYMGTKEERERERGTERATESQGAERESRDFSQCASNVHHWLITEKSAKLWKIKRRDNIAARIKKTRTSAFRSLRVRELFPRESSLAFGLRENF